MSLIYIYIPDPTLFGCRSRWRCHADPFILAQMALGQSTQVIPSQGTLWHRTILITIYILLWFTMIDCHGETLPTSLKRVETCWNDLNSIIRSRVVVWRDIDWKAVDNASSSAMLTSSESILESKSWESVGIMTPLVEDLFMTFPLYNVFFQPYVIYKTMGVTNDISNFNAKNPQIIPNPYHHCFNKRE